MNFDTALYEPLQLQLSDVDAGAAGPLVLWGGILVLRGGEEARHGLTQRQEINGITTWRTVTITDTRLIYAEAAKAISGWDAYEEVSEADSHITWARPLSEIKALELTDQTTTKGTRGDDRQWSMGARVVFQDGTVVTLPLFGGRAGYGSREIVEKALSWLASRLWRSL
jgi:hypothetical protein